MWRTNFCVFHPVEPDLQDGTPIARKWPTAALVELRNTGHLLQSTHCPTSTRLPSFSTCTVVLIVGIPIL